MGVLDIIILVVLFAGGIVVSIKGFFRELGAKASYFVGFLTSMMFTRRLASFIYSRIEAEELLVSFLTYLVLFFVGFFLCRVLSSVLEKATDGIGLSVVDKILGFVLGMIESLICIAVVIWLLGLQNLFDFSSVLSNSFFYNKVFYPMYTVIIGSAPRVGDMIGK